MSSNHVDECFRGDLDKRIHDAKQLAHTCPKNKAIVNDLLAYMRQEIVDLDNLASRQASVIKGRDKTMAGGVGRIGAERRRQVEEEGWTPEHDDQHSGGELTMAAACYAMAFKGKPAPSHWPWEGTWWKPKSRMRNLEKAGALIAAEIDRLKRLPEVHASTGKPEPGGMCEATACHCGHSAPATHIVKLQACEERVSKRCAEAHMLAGYPIRPIEPKE